jgi:hypothetical protein
MGPKLSFPSVPLSTAQSMLSQWLLIMKRKENALIVFSPKGGAYRRIEQLLLWKSLQKKILGSSVIRYCFHSFSLLPYSHATLADISQKIVSEVKKKNKNALHYFLLYDADTWFTDHRIDIFVGLSELTEAHSDIRILLYCEKNITNSAYRHLLTDKTTLAQNILIHPLYSRSDMDYFIDDICKHWGMTISKTVKTGILDTVGRQTWLIKEAMRLYQARGISPSENLLSEPSMHVKVSALWDDFSTKEQLLLKGIANNEPIEYSSSNEELHHLLRLEILKQESDNSVSCTIPLLLAYIHEQASAYRLSIRDEKLYLDTKPLSSELSKKEYTIVYTLISSQNTIVKRQTLAQLLWPNNEYSDWSLDQLISRVRRKIQKLGVNSNQLVTHKKIGFQWKI